MKILFVTNSLMTGGAEKVFMLEARELSARGHDVHMLLLFRAGELADSLALPRERVHVARMRSVFDVAGFFRALGIVRDIQPDVMYSTLNEGNFVARLLALFVWHARVVSREANMADVKGVLYRLGDRVLGWRPSVIIAVSRAVGDSVLSYAPYLKNRIRVLYNPVSLPEPREHAAHKGTKLLNVGSLTPKKDQQILVRALEFLSEDFSVTFVGDGQERASLEGLAAELKVENRVTFVGPVSPERVGEFYASHDVFVLTSSREGCPNVVLEALSHKLPVVTFDIPGMKEFVSPEWGALVEKRDPHALAEAIQRTATSSEARARLGTRGYDHVKHEHSVEQHMDDLGVILNLLHTSE